MEKSRANFLDDVNSASRMIACEMEKHESQNPKPEVSFTNAHSVDLSLDNIEDIMDEIRSARYTFGEE